MPGYELLESDRNSIPAKYFCSFCSQLLRDPKQTACGHCYCRLCIDNCFVNGNFEMECISCGEKVAKNEIFPDNFIKREVLALEVHCRNRNEGCPWEGEVRELETHNSVCEYTQVLCPHPTCGMMVKKSELAKHLESQCSCRMVKCDFCKAEISINAVEAHHNNDCPSFPVKCTKCNNFVQRHKLTEHQEPARGDCEAIDGPCPFVNVGCPQVEPMVVDKRKKHMKDAAVSHLTLLSVMVTKIGEDVQNLITGEGRAASGAVASAIGRAASGAFASTMGRDASGTVASIFGRPASGPVGAVMEAAASSTAAFLGDSENTMRNLVSHVEGVVEENKDLRQRLREQSERLTSVERRTVSLRDNSNEGDNTSRIPNTDPASTTQAEITRRLVNVENKAADNDILLTESNKSVEDVRRQNSYLQRQLELSQENVRRLERRVESQDHMLALRNVALADLEEYIRQQEVSSYDGILLWKISDFARRRSDAQGGRQTSFYSPSFYTSRHGYKMCARIYLNGDGMGKGTHISLFFVVMRGQYDSLLRWPFRQKVNLMILDQDNMEHVIDAFRPDPNSSSFQKPRREMNIASGCPLFFPLSDLNTHAYVRDDTMFVKIIVDTSDL